jgi:hypothetical protein
MEAVETNHLVSKETTMAKDVPQKLGNVIQIDKSQIQEHLGELVRGTVEDTLNKLLDAEAAQLCNAAHYDFPSAYWRRIRTNNPLERILREVRRRTRVVEAFPDGNSALRLVAARLRHTAGTRWGTRRYLNMRLLLKRL